MIFELEMASESYVVVVFLVSGFVIVAAGGSGSEGDDSQKDDGDLHGSKETSVELILDKSWWS